MKRPDYFPDKGDRAYAVSHYDLSLSYDVDSNHLRGKAALLVEAVTDVTEVRLDLIGMRVTKVTVDGDSSTTF